MDRRLARPLTARRGGGGSFFARWVAALRPLLGVCALVETVAFSAAEPARFAPSVAELKSPYPAPPFAPPAEHPRVYFRAADLPRLREWVQHPQNAAAWARHEAAVARGTDGVLPPKREGGDNFDAAKLATIESLAFDFALRGNEAAGRQAVAAMRAFARTLQGGDYNLDGQTIFTIGLVYDWCYPLLTAAERSELVERAVALAAELEVGWPPVKQGNVTGHGPEGQLQRDLLVAAVAFYDERPDFYRLIAGRIFDRFVATKRFMYPAHMHHQGSHYANYRFQWEMLATWTFARMGWPELFGPDQQYLMYWSLYARRPDGQLLRDGDTHINNRAPGALYTAPARSMFLAANYWRDPVLKAAALRLVAEPMTPRGNQSLNPVEWLVFNDPTIPALTAPLPLTKYFPSPKGGMIARTGWDEGIGSRAVVAEFKVNEWYFANHQHLDAGAFQIYYRGALATDSGYYQAAIQGKKETPDNNGDSRYGSLHDVNYHKRTVAHNTITVFDPAEKFVTTRWGHYPISNDGGQRFPNRWQEPREHEELIDPANRYRIAQVLGWGVGPDAIAPDYSYLKGDLRDAYSEKVRAFERSFVFLNLKDDAHPAALVVFDRVVSAQPEFRKAWLLHGLEEPQVAGNRTVFRDTRAGYTGKLTVDTLLPEPGNTEIEKIGGPGREFWVNGQNYPAATHPDGVNEGGGWRIEVRPRAAANEDLFLNVLQVGDHTPDTPALAVERLGTATHLGVRLADRVVLLGRGRDRSAAAVEFELPMRKGAPWRVVVADLVAGEWRWVALDRASDVTLGAVVSAQAGIAAGELAPGRWRLERRP
jgi:hypothetical protein